MVNVQKGKGCYPPSWCGCLLWCAALGSPPPAVLYIPEMAACVQRLRTEATVRGRKKVRASPRTASLIHLLHLLTPPPHRLPQLPSNHSSPILPNFTDKFLFFRGFSVVSRLTHMMLFMMALGQGWAMMSHEDRNNRPRYSSYTHRGSIHATLTVGDETALTDSSAPLLLSHHVHFVSIPFLSVYTYRVLTVV